MVNHLGMASPITGNDFPPLNLSSDVCARISQLLEIYDTLNEWFTWAFNADGSASDAFKVLFQDIAVAVGVVVFRPIATIPAGYLLCNGQAVSRTIYANLFAVFGTTFGTGDGSTTFNLPNLQGYFLMGSGPAGANPVGSTGGEATHTLTESEMPTHSHGYPTGDDASGFLLKTSVAGKSLDIAGSGDAIQVPETAEAGSSQAHNNLPPYFSGYWLVKY